MKNFMARILLDKKDDPAPGGEPNPAPTPAPTPDPGTPPKNTPAPEAEGDFDDLGYPIAKKEGDPKPPVKKDDPPVKEEPIEPSTGYGVDDPPPVVDDKPVVDPPPAAPAPPATDLDKALEGLHKDDLADIKALAEKAKLTPEQAKEIAAARIAERDAATKWSEKSKVDQAAQIEREKMKIRSDWHKELKADKDFGGEHFATNLQQVEKVLRDFLPGLKNQLTKTKAMLPPYVMRDLAKLADRLYETEKIVHGDPAVPSEEAKDPVDEALDFYKT